MPIPDEFKERRDFDVRPNIRLSCGERYSHIVEKYEFVLCLTDLSDPKAEKFLELTKESFDLFIDYEAKIINLINQGLKAIIFQQLEVQLFIWQYDEAVGFQAHFQDKRFTTISINKKTITKLVRLQKDVDEEYNKYKLRRLVKKKRPGRWNRDEKLEKKKKPSSKNRSTAL